MIINENHIEYAPIRRMREMLARVDEKDKFGVTRTYVMFTAVLCWTVQRLREHEREIKWPNANDGMGERAWQLWKDLKREPIESPPWSIRTSPVEVGQNIAQIGAPGSFEAFAGFDAARFLVALRNAVAHGDGRRIIPARSRDKGREYFSGYTFKCNERKRNADKACSVWHGDVTLRKEDMCRIGVELCDRFCKALEGNDQYMASEAVTIRERAA